MSLQSETTVVDERVRIDAYRLKEGKGERVRIWKRHWVIIGATLNNLWYYIQPTSVVSPQTRRNPIEKMRYVHGMCWKEDWDRGAIEQVVLYVPPPDEVIISTNGDIVRVKDFYPYLKQAVTAHGLS